MKRRDWLFFKASALLLISLFSPLILHPGTTPGNFHDIYSYHYPLRHLVAATLQEGRLPLWNPYIFAGTPLAANPQAALFYPFSLLHYFFPLSWALSLHAFLHLLLAVLGAALLLRRWGLDSTGSWMLSIAYGLSPFLLTRTAQGIPTHLAALTWIPWVWLAAQSAHPAWLGLTFAIQTLSGHPQFALLNLSGLILYIASRRPAKLLHLLQAGTLAFCLAAVQCCPTIEFLKNSVRSIWDPMLATGYSFKLRYLLTLLYPYVHGHPLEQGFSLFPSEYFEMLTNYIGLIPLGLAVIGLKRSWPLALIAGTGLFFALGQNNPMYLVLQRLLGLDFLRTPARFSFLILWALWLAAAVGWKRLRPKMPVLLAGALALATAIDLLAWGGRWIYAQDPKQYLPGHSAAVTALRHGNARFATEPDFPSPNKAMLDRLFNATGYEAFYLARIAVYTARSEKGPAADGSRTHIRRWFTPEMSRLGVRYYVTLTEITGRRPAFRQGDLFIYENPVAEPLVQGSNSWTLLSPEHWRIRLDQNIPVLVSQAMYPGWKAWANGKRIAIGLKDDLFPVLSAPKDTPPPWTVHFRFLPETWFVGMWISAATLLAAAVLLYRKLTHS